MKEASGELNMTLVTIVAVAAIAGLFVLLFPTIKKAITNKWSDTTSMNSGSIVNKEQQ